MFHYLTVKLGLINWDRNLELGSDHFLHQVTKYELVPLLVALGGIQNGSFKKVFGWCASVLTLEHTGLSSGPTESKRPDGNLALSQLKKSGCRFTENQANTHIKMNNGRG